MKICEYGCVQEAKYKMTSGKWCCSEFYQCPKIREKNTLGNKSCNHFSFLRGKL
jgi:hypothetical protein